MEHMRDVKSLQLSDHQFENLVAGGLEFLLHFLETAFRFEVFKQSLDMGFNIGLFEAIAMLFSLDVTILHVLILITLLLPVEFKINVPGDCGDGQALVCQFHNLL